MPFNLEYNRNYVYLFFMFVASVLLFGFALGEEAAGVVFFLWFCYLGFLQLNSGIALNRSWKAAIKKEAHPYQFYIVTAGCFLIAAWGLVVALVLHQAK